MSARARARLTLAHALVAPLCLSVALFYLGPILFGVWASFQREGAAMAGGGFIGLGHYASLMRDCGKFVAPPTVNAPEIVAVGLFGSFSGKSRLRRTREKRASFSIPRRRMSSAARR